MQDKLETLFEQMERELSHLSQGEKQLIKRYIVWAFERGESSVIERLRR